MSVATNTPTIADCSSSRSRKNSATRSLTALNDPMTTIGIRNVVSRISQSEIESMPNEKLMPSCDIHAKLFVSCFSAVFSKSNCESISSDSAKVARVIPAATYFAVLPWSLLFFEIKGSARPPMNGIITSRGSSMLVVKFSDCSARVVSNGATSCFLRSSNLSCLIYF